MCASDAGFRNAVAADVPAATALASAHFRYTARTDRWQSDSD
jgi:hypothetical protein